MKFFSRFILCLMLSFSLVEFPVMYAYAGTDQIAGPISTKTLVNNLNRAEHQRKVAEFVKRADVQEQLSQLGVSSEEAEKRVAALSDQEVNQLSQDIDSATLGGDLGGILVLVLVIVLIIYLVKRI